jgi:hypothetical protein
LNTASSKEEIIRLSLAFKRSLKKALHSNDLPTEFVKWREKAADRNQWRAFAVLKRRVLQKRHRPLADMKSGLTKKRQCSEPIYKQKLTRKLEMSKENEQKERKNTYSQTSRL